MWSVILISLIFLPDFCKIEHRHQNLLITFKQPFMVSDRMAVFHRILKQKSVLNNRLVKNSIVCMFSPLLYQDHLRVFLASTGLCPGAKGSRSFFLVTTASSYSVMMKKKSFFKQMSRVVKFFWILVSSVRWSRYLRAPWKIPSKSRLCSQLVSEHDFHWALMWTHLIFPSAHTRICSRALTGTWVSGRSRVSDRNTILYRCSGKGFKC